MRSILILQSNISSNFNGLENRFRKFLIKWTPSDIRKLVEKFLSREETKQIKSLGKFEKLMETLKKRLENRKNVTKVEINGLAQLELHLLVYGLT